MPGTAPVPREGVLLNRYTVGVPRDGFLEVGPICFWLQLGTKDDDLVRHLIQFAKLPSQIANLKLREKKIHQLEIAHQLSLYFGRC